MLVILVLAFFILCPDEGAAVKPGLELTALGPKLVKGRYQYDDLLGIQFDIRPSSMKMKNLRGDTLAAYTKLARDAHYFQIADQGFLSVEKKPIRAVPKDLSKTKEALNNFATIVANQQSSDEGENVRTTHEAALEKLSKFDETRLFEATSKAIADEGGSGTKLEITQPYHLLSLNLLKALHKTGRPVHSLKKTNDNEGPHRVKRCTDLRRYKRNDCFGMCGKACKCWKWVCGDCCYHTGCAQHDYCCRKKFWSKYCLFPWKYQFSCVRFGGYSRC